MGGEAASFLKHRFLRPRPRVELGRQLRNVATAAMDVSDGLLTDLKKVCAASGCGARLNVDALPESAALRELFEADDCWQYALAGGDDYELLFTLPPERAAALRTLQLQQRVTQIGVMTAEPSVLCLLDGQPFRIKRGGYDHFAASEGG
jgi:thiamine-monophosphate kinase